MVAVIDRPDLDGAWLNIGGPRSIRPPRVAEVLSRVIGRPTNYEPCTPAEFGRYLCDTWGDEMTPTERAVTEERIAAF